MITVTFEILPSTGSFVYRSSSGDSHTGQWKITFACGATTLGSTTVTATGTTVTVSPDHVYAFMSLEGKTCTYSISTISGEEPVTSSGTYTVPGSEAHGALSYMRVKIDPPMKLSTPSLSISCDDAVLATITETESATTFHLEYRRSGSSTWSEYTGDILSEDSNTETVDLTDLLTGGTIYEFRAYCSDSSGKYEASDYSEIVSFKLFSKVAYKSVKSRTTSSISFYTTNLGLTSGTTWIAQYKKRGTDAWLTATTSNTSSQLTVSSNSNLTADSVYDFRIRLTRNEGESTWFYVAQTTKGNQTATPPTCTAGSTTIAATWTPPKGYNWYQLSATLNGTVVARNDWTQETSGTLTGLTPGTAYVARVQYRITAVGDAYENDGYRGAVDVTTLDIIQLATPTGLTATNVTNNSADLGWSAIENASNYRVDYRIYGDTLWQQTTSN